MFDEEDIGGDRNSKGELDDFDYYVSYIKALEEEQVSKSEIARELMEEFDLEKDEVLRILRRYYAEKDSYSDYDDGEDDFVEDDDYSDGNSEL